MMIRSNVECFYYLFLYVSDTGKRLNNSLGYLTTDSENGASINSQWINNLERLARLTETAWHYFDLLVGFFD